MLKSVLTACLLLLSFAASAQSPQSDADNNLAVAIPPNGYPPFIIVNHKEPSGILIEALKQAAAPHHIQLVFHYFPEKRAARLVDLKQIDVRMESPAWVDQPDKYLWSEDIIQLADIIISNKHNNYVDKNNHALAGYEIATHLGYGYPTLEALFQSGKATRKDYSTEIDMLTAVAQKRDVTKRVTVMNRQVAQWVLKDHKELANHLVFSDRILDSAPLKFQFADTEKNRKLVPLINASIKKLRAEKRLEAISKQFLSGAN